MKFNFRLMILVVGCSVLFSSCSFNAIESRSNGTTNSNSAIVQSNDPTSANTATEGEPASADEFVAGNNTTGPLTADNNPNVADAETAESDSNGLMEAKRQKFNTLRGLGPDGKPLTPGKSGPPPPPRITEAPDNSTFAVSLTDVAREVRTFRNNPTLIRVERVLSGKEQTAQVFLKNGKVLNFPADKFEGLGSMSAQEILARSGLVRTDDAGAAKGKGE